MVDASRLESRATQGASRAPILRGAPSGRATLRAFRITIGAGQSVWLTDDDPRSFAALPGNAVFIDAPLAEGGLPTIRRTPGFTTGKTTLGIGSYRFLDDKHELGAWFAQKTATGLQLFSRFIEQFDFEDGDDLDDAETLERSRRYTFQVRDAIAMDRRVYEIRCADIQRDLDVDIFTPLTWRLYSTIDALEDATIMMTVGPDEVGGVSSALFEHGPDYRIHPGEVCGIALLKDGDRREYFSYSAFSGASVLESGRSLFAFQVLGRGLFGTGIQEWEIDQETPEENRLEIEAVPYAEEDPMSLLYAVSVGETLDGRAFPWNAGVGKEWINKDSLLRASSERRRTLRGYDKTKALGFIETEILSLMPGVLTPNTLGELTFKAGVFGQESSSVVLDESAVYGADTGALVHDASEVAYPFRMEWDYREAESKYKQVTELFDPDAATESGASKPITIQSKLISTARSTESEVRATLARLSTLHARPVKRLSVQPKSGMWYLDAGDIVQVRLPVRDYADYDGVYRDLDAPMMIASVSHDQNSGRMSWDLIGFRPPPPAIGAGTEPLPLSAFTDGGTELSGVGGVSVSSGIYSGSPVLELGRKYYIDGDAELGPGFTPAMAGLGELRLWCRGVLIIACTLDVSGRGMRGGVGATTGAGSSGAQGAVPAIAPTGSLGTRLLRSTNEGGDVQGVIRRTLRSRPPADHPRASPVEFAEIPTVERGRIVGGPPTLAGSGGAGGDGSATSGLDDRARVVPSDSTTIRGSDGARGSAGIEIVARPGSGFSGNGKLILRGDDAPQPTISSLLGGYGASGAGGAYGMVHWIQDGAGTAPNASATTIIAEHGDTPRPGALLAEPSYSYGGEGGGGYRSYYDTADDEGNRWGNAYRHAVLPESQIVSDSVYDRSQLTDAISVLLRRQRDNQIVIQVTANRGPPSDGDPGDLSIAQADLDDHANDAPFAYILTDTGWEEFDWSTANSLYRLLLDNLRADEDGDRIISATERPDSPGDLWHNPETGAIVRLNASGVDEPIAFGEVQVGENRISDPRFVRWKAGEYTWFPRTSLTSQKPEFGLLLNQGTPSGTPTYDLPPPAYINASAYSNGYIEINTGRAYSTESITGYELRRDSTLIHTFGTSAGSFLDTSPPATGQIEYAVRSIGAGGLRSEDITVITSSQYDGSTPAGGAPVFTLGSFGGSFERVGATDSGPTAPPANTLDPVTNLVANVYSGTALGLLWDPPADRTGAERTEVYQDSVQVASYSDLNVNSYVTDTLFPGTTYVFFVRIVGAGSERSDDVSVTATTNS